MMQSLQRITMQKQHLSAAVETCLVMHAAAAGGRGEAMGETTAHKAIRPQTLLSCHHLRCGLIVSKTLWLAYKVYVDIRMRDSAKKTKNKKQAQSLTRWLKRKVSEITNKLEPDVIYVTSSILITFLLAIRLSLSPTQACAWFVKLFKAAGLWIFCKGPFCDRFSTTVMWLNARSEAPQWEATVSNVSLEMASRLPARHQLGDNGYYQTTIKCYGSTSRLWSRSALTD